MTVKDLLDKVRGLPPETLVCIAEIGQIYASNVGELEIVEEADLDAPAANGAEVIPLEGGAARVLVVRW